MDEKYNKIAREALLKSSVILPGQVEAVAQALRDVQRETASTCSQIAHNRIFIVPEGWGCGPELAKQRKIIQEAIEECFLKEKP